MLEYKGAKPSTCWKEMVLNLEFYIHPNYPSNMKTDTESFSDMSGFKVNRNEPFLWTLLEGIYTPEKWKKIKKENVTESRKQWKQPRNMVKCSLGMIVGSQANGTTAPGGTQSTGDKKKVRL